MKEGGGRFHRSFGTAEFDRYAKDYSDLVDRSVRFSGFTSSYFAERKIREILFTLRTASVEGSPLRFLNFGCGTGSSERYIAGSFPRADICSVDVSPKSVEIAKEKNRGIPTTHFSVFDGIHVPFRGPFDVILLAGVLHHITSKDQPAVMHELYSLLADTGYLFIFEHNPWNPLTRRVVRACPLDEQAELVPPPAAHALLREAGFTRCDVRFIHFFPKVLRFLIPAERWLGKMPLGAQYYCVARKQDRSGPTVLR